MFVIFFVKNVTKVAVRLSFRQSKLKWKIIYLVIHNKKLYKVNTKNKQCKHWRQQKRHTHNHCFLSNGIKYLPAITCTAYACIERYQGAVSFSIGNDFNFKFCLPCSNFRSFSQTGMPVRNNFIEILSRDTWFPTMWHFDKCRLRRACTVSF